MQKFCITFAWCVWSSKTPISNYISTKLNLPIFNNDAILSEVIENRGFWDIEEHKKVRNNRLKEVLDSWISFIADISIDREWESFRETLLSYGYTRFIISLNLSKGLLMKLYKAKGYDESLKRLDTLMHDHESFLENFSDDVGVHVWDDQFFDRLEIALRSIRAWIESM